ncbi:MAG: hypothetical protein J2P25_09805 [Nocardiopsaceae bacterium]|nr:hypothetical protein [Nocardiopsaceae bacterium]
MLVAACGSNAQHNGKQAAQQARRVVAQEYWRTIRVLTGNIFKGKDGPDGDGGFDNCGSEASPGVKYEIISALTDPDRHQSWARFAGVIQQDLRRSGWHGFHTLGSDDPDVQSYLVGVKSGLTVSIGKPANSSPPTSALTTLSGSCVDVSPGIANAVAGRTDDRYPFDRASESPVPTTFP